MKTGGHRPPVHCSEKPRLGSIRYPNPSSALRAPEPELEPLSLRPAFSGRPSSWPPSLLLACVSWRLTSFSPPFSSPPVSSWRLTSSSLQAVSSLPSWQQASSWLLVSSLLRASSPRVSSLLLPCLTPFDDYYHF